MIIREITQNAKGEFLPNPEGIVLYVNDIPILSEKINNFLAILAEEFFYASENKGKRLIDFPETVDISGIRYILIATHGSANGNFSPFGKGRVTLNGEDLAEQLGYHLHYKDRHYGTLKRTIMEQLEHISCQTCYGARLAENASQHLSNLASSEGNLGSFEPTPELSISGSPYRVYSYSVSDLFVLLNPNAYIVIIDPELLYNIGELARGSNNLGFERGHFKRYTISQRFYDASDAFEKEEEEFHDAFEQLPFDI